MREDLRCLWMNPWWLETDTPPELTDEEKKEDRDFCREQIGVSPEVQGQIILLRSGISYGNGVELPQETIQIEQRQVRLGFVLKKGRHAYPPSETYGINGHQNFCEAGHWVEYAFWEKTDSALSEKILSEDGSTLLIYYVPANQIKSVIHPKDYPIVLKGMR